MITKIVDHDCIGYAQSGARRIVEFRGKSTDIKPDNCANGSIFYEMDTKKLFMWDAESNTWIEQ